jgi:hypothetical protein
MEHNAGKSKRDCYAHSFHEWWIHGGGQKLGALLWKAAARGWSETSYLTFKAPKLCNRGLSSAAVFGTYVECGHIALIHHQMIAAGSHVFLRL